MTCHAMQLDEVKLILTNGAVGHLRDHRPTCLYLGVPCMRAQNVHQTSIK